MDHICTLGRAFRRAGIHRPVHEEPYYEVSGAIYDVSDHKRFLLSDVCKKHGKCFQHVLG